MNKEKTRLFDSEFHLHSSSDWSSKKKSLNDSPDSLNNSFSSSTPTRNNQSLRFSRHSLSPMSSPNLPYKFDSIKRSPSNDSEVKEYKSPLLTRADSPYKNIYESFEKKLENVSKKIMSDVSSRYTRPSISPVSKFSQKNKTPWSYSTSSPPLLYSEEVQKSWKELELKYGRDFPFLRDSELSPSLSTGRNSNYASPQLRNQKPRSSFAPDDDIKLSPPSLNRSASSLSSPSFQPITNLPSPKVQHTPISTHSTPSNKAQASRLSLISNRGSISENINSSSPSIISNFSDQQKTSPTIDEHYESKKMKDTIRILREQNKKLDQELILAKIQLDTKNDFVREALSDTISSKTTSDLVGQGELYSNNSSLKDSTKNDKFTDEASNQIEELEFRVKNLTKSIDSKSQEIDELQQILSTISHNLDQSHKQNNQLESMLNDSLLSRQELENKYLSSSQKLEILSKQMDNYEEMLSKSIAYDELVLNFENAQLQLDEFSNREKDLLEEINEMKQKIYDADINVRDLSERALKCYTLELSLDNITKLLHEKDIEILDLKEKIYNFEKNDEINKNNLSLIDNEMNNLQLKIVSIEEELFKEKDQKNKALEQIGSSQDKISNLHQENIKLLQEINELKNSYNQNSDFKIIELEKFVNELKQSNEQLNYQLVISHNSNNELRILINQHEERIGNYKNDIKDLVLSVKNFSEQIESLNQQILSLQQQNSELKQELKSKNQQEQNINVANDEISSLQIVIDTLTSENKNLRDNLELSTEKITKEIEKFSTILFEKDQLLQQYSNKENNNSNTLNETLLEKEYALESLQKELNKNKQLVQRIQELEEIMIENESKYENDKLLLIQSLQDSNSSSIQIEEKLSELKACIELVKNERESLNLKANISNHEQSEKVISNYEDKIQQEKANFEEKLQNTISSYEDKIEKTISDYKEKIQDTIKIYEDKIQIEKSSQEEMIHLLQSQIQEKVNLSNKLQDQLNNLNNEKSNIEEKLQDSLSSNIEKIQELNSKILEKDELSKKLQDELNHLKIDFDKLQQSTNILKENTQILNNNLEDSRLKIQSLESELKENKSIATSSNDISENYEKIITELKIKIQTLENEIIENNNNNKLIYEQLSSDSEAIQKWKEIVSNIANLRASSKNEKNKIYESLSVEFQKEKIQLENDQKQIKYLENLLSQKQIELDEIHQSIDNLNESLKENQRNSQKALEEKESQLQEQINKFETLSKQEKSSKSENELRIQDLTNQIQQAQSKYQELESVSNSISKQLNEKVETNQQLLLTISTFEKEKNELSEQLQHQLILHEDQENILNQTLKELQILKEEIQNQQLQQSQKQSQKQSQDQIQDQTQEKNQQEQVNQEEIQTLVTDLLQTKNEIESWNNKLAVIRFLKKSVEAEKNLSQTQSQSQSQTKIQSPIDLSEFTESELEVIREEVRNDAKRVLQSPKRHLLVEYVQRNKTILPEEEIKQISNSWKQFALQHFIESTQTHLKNKDLNQLQEQMKVYHKRVQDKTFTTSDSRISSLITQVESTLKVLKA